MALDSDSCIQNPWFWLYIATAIFWFVLQERTLMAKKSGGNLRQRSIFRAMWHLPDSSLKRGALLSFLTTTALLGPFLNHPKKGELLYISAVLLVILCFGLSDFLVKKENRNTYAFVLWFLIGGVFLFLVDWRFWPETLVVDPTEFTFRNPPIPEMFSVTVSNRSAVRMNGVQFDIEVEDNSARENDFEFGIPPSSRKIVGQSDDGPRLLADMLLFACRDEDRPMFVFFIPYMNPGEVREVTITSLNHSTSLVRVNPIDYYDRPLSSGLSKNGYSGQMVRLSPKISDPNCRMPNVIPWEFFINRDGTGAYEQFH